MSILGVFKGQRVLVEQLQIEDDKVLSLKRSFIFTIIAILVGVASAFFFIKKEDGLQSENTANLKNIDEKVALSQKKMVESLNDKKEFIRDYFSEIKTRPLEESWALLSKNFKRNQKYEDYADWWGKQVALVGVEDVYPSKDERIHAILNYKLKNGNEYCAHDIFDVIPNNEAFAIEHQDSSICD